MHWDEYFMSLAFLVAMKSKDDSTHNGAVIVTKDNSLVSTGYNSFVRGANDDVKERQERPEKYYWFEHSERNAIYEAARKGSGSLKGCKIYVTGVPCMDCARAIVQVGIDEVIILPEHSERMGSVGWSENQSRTMNLFDEVGVKLRFYDGKLTTYITGRIRGEDYELNKA